MIYAPASLAKPYDALLCAIRAVTLPIEGWDSYECPDEEEEIYYVGPEDDPDNWQDEAEE